MIGRRSAAPSPRPPSRGSVSGILVFALGLTAPHAVNASVADDWIGSLEQCRLAIETDLVFEEMELIAASDETAQLFVVAPQTLTMESGFVLEVTPGVPAPRRTWNSVGGHFLLGEWSNKCSIKPVRDMDAIELRGLLTVARDAQRKLVEAGSHVTYDMGMPDAFAVMLEGRNDKDRCVVSYVVLAEGESKLIAFSGEQSVLFCLDENEGVKE